MNIIKISPDGNMSFIYSDDMADLLTQGKATVNRASHVEPSDEGGWQADMTPVGGPVLTGFPLRADALEAEVSYLNSRFFSWD